MLSLWVKNIACRYDKNGPNKQIRDLLVGMRVQHCPEGALQKGARQKEYLTTPRVPYCENCQKDIMNRFKSFCERI